MTPLETRYAAALDAADEFRLQVESASVAPSDSEWWAARYDALATAHREMARRLTRLAQQRRGMRPDERMQYEPEGL